jgi:hypothetical protein
MRFSKTILIGLLLAAFPCRVAPAQTPEKAQAASPTKEQAEKYHSIYQQLVERVKKGDSGVDFVDLIAAASDWEVFSKTLIEAPHRDEMVAAFKAKNYSKAVDLAESVLDYEFTNRSLHRATANAYRELGNTAKADFHNGVGEKILKALLTTGDGKSAETAYCVQSINEEYVIMSYFGYEVSSQAYIGSSSSDYDLLEGKDKKTGKKAGLYFDISGHFTRCVQSHKQKKT